MAHIFTTAVVGLVIYMNVHVLIPHTSARPLQRHERQTQPFSVDDILHFGLEALDKTACPGIYGSHWPEVEEVCEVFQSLYQLEDRINVVTDNFSINDTATEIKDMICSKIQDIVSDSFVVSLPTDCSDENFELICARALICSDAIKAQDTLEANPAFHLSNSQWINEHIEEGATKTFVCIQVTQSKTADCN